MDSVNQTGSKKGWVRFAEDPQASSDPQVNQQAHQASRFSEQSANQESPNDSDVESESELKQNPNLKPTG